MYVQVCTMLGTACFPVKIGFILFRYLTLCQQSTYFLLQASIQSIKIGLRLAVKNTRTVLVLLLHHLHRETCSYIQWYCTLVGRAIGGQDSMVMTVQLFVFLVCIKTVCCRGYPACCSS